ncbi:MAG: hypothetical protein QOJ04_6835, partial [Caballeronia sp.]|nr:hypothetical protein [Caballeronia sp.]
MRCAEFSRNQSFPSRYLRAEPEVGSGDLLFCAIELAVRPLVPPRYTDNRLSGKKIERAAGASDNESLAFGMLAPGGGGTDPKADDIPAFSAH